MATNYPLIEKEAEGTHITKVLFSNFDTQNYGQSHSIGGLLRGFLLKILFTHLLVVSSIHNQMRPNSSLGQNNHPFGGHPMHERML